ncbi:hypothetical protein ACHAW5_005306 [Stephanodiscus triporus]|uniref:Uncharacterized protein n=1 Tax=Stephanodiscus triporus TaxID=2934178 RepID=A0ABD3PFH4_9STRA
MLNVADVAHSMQSWEIFLFWNRSLFEELHVAFKMGRARLTPQMQKCGVFGKLGWEWMKNAVLIRDRWCIEGEQITKDMIAMVKTIF